MSVSGKITRLGPGVDADVKGNEVMDRFASITETVSLAPSKRSKHNTDPRVLSAHRRNSLDPTEIDGIPRPYNKDRGSDAAQLESESQRRQRILDHFDTLHALQFTDDNTSWVMAEISRGLDRREDFNQLLLNTFTSVNSMNSRLRILEDLQVTSAELATMRACSAEKAASLFSDFLN